VFVVFPDRENPETPSELVAHDRRATVRPAATALSQMELEARAESAPVPADIGPRLALIDFGMTAHLSNSLRECIVRLLLDLSDNRGDNAAETLIEMGQAAEGFDRANYVRTIAALVSRNYDRSVGEIKAGSLIYEIINLSYRSGLKLPAELTLLGKAMFNLDAVTRALDPTFNPVEAVRDFGNQIAAERARRELSAGRLYQMATQASDLLTALPRRIDVITSRLAAGELGVRVDAPQLTILLQGLQKVANRILSGLVLCGLLIASAMLMPYRRSLGTAGFIISAAIGLFMILAIVTTDRGRPQQ
jgi:predicted unusual protein kinase regulating ubiquinone biosynthesis (AarF/ABC1/UbiB family)